MAASSQACARCCAAASATPSDAIDTGGALGALGSMLVLGTTVSTAGAAPDPLDGVAHPVRSTTEKRVDAKTKRRRMASC